jgi:hypothetical protein
MPSPKIRPAFKEYVKNSSRSQLERDLATLFNTFGEVREYYQTLLLPNGEEISLAHAKQIISDEFYPTHGFGKARAAIARKAITSFSRLSPSREALIDVLLHHVEIGVAFTKEYGDIDEPFYLSIERSFERALALLTTSNLRERFQERCKEIVSASDGIGWGFHDTLAGLYYQLYDKDE